MGVCEIHEGNPKAKYQEGEEFDSKKRFTVDSTEIMDPKSHQSEAFESDQAVFDFQLDETEKLSEV